MKQVISLLVALGFSLGVSAFEIDSSKSEFKWTGKKVTGQHYGTLPIKSTNLTIKNKQLVGGEIVLDITQMTVDDLEGETQTKFLTHMKSQDFFNVKKWPSAKLVLSELNGKTAKGTLFIKDKSQPVIFPYTKKGDLYSGVLKFDRTKFGMVYGSGSFFKGLGDKMIYNDVTLEFKVKVVPSKDKLAKD